MGRALHFEIHAGDMVAAGGAQVLDRMEIPGVGQVSCFKDTEGNIFGALQPAPA